MSKFLWQAKALSVSTHKTTRHCNNAVPIVVGETDALPIFKRLLTHCGLLKDTVGSDRTLYSLRHTYATLDLLAGTDIHTLARQMGTSVLMLERHYSKLTATLAADKLAG